MHGTMDFQRAEQREQLVFGCSYDPEKYKMGGVRYFNAMSVDTAKKLLDLNFIDPDDAQNLSPTAQEMINFCDDGTDKWYLHGYVVSPDRDDCRISFEGCGSSQDLTPQEALDFMRTFRLADDLDCEIGCHAYCWFD